MLFFQARPLNDVSSFSFSSVSAISAGKQYALPIIDSCDYLHVRWNFTRIFHEEKILRSTRFVTTQIYDKQRDKYDWLHDTPVARLPLMHSRCLPCSSLSAQASLIIRRQAFTDAFWRCLTDRQKNYKFLTLSIARGIRSWAKGNADIVANNHK